MVYRRELKLKKRYSFPLLILCVLSVYTYSSSAQVSSFCNRVFFNRKASVFAGVESNNLLAQIKGLRMSEESHRFDNRKQIREFEKGLMEMKEFLERSPTHKEQDVLRRLGVSIEQPISKIPEIMEFVQTVDPTKGPYFGQIAQAVLAVFSKHIPTILKEDASQTDWSRMNNILRTIAAFDRQRPQFSLYKIKRAIEGRYSLKEFILCRV